jgi:Ca2+-binding EF-hand superfamily protein
VLIPSAQQITVQSPNEREILEAFKVFDPSGAGSIDTKELKHYFMTLGDFKEAEVDEMLSAADTNNAGNFRYYQFVKSVLLQ